MQPKSLPKFCFGLGLATVTAKGMLLWAISRFQAETSPLAEISAAETFDPALNLVAVVALIGIAGGIAAFVKGARGHLLYASLVLNSLALLVKPML